MFIFLICVLFCIFIYYKFIRPCSYWKTKKITQVRPWPLVGNFGDAILGRKHFSEILTEIYEKFPDEKYTGYMQFSRRSLLLRDLKLILELTNASEDDFPNFGDKWKKIFECNTKSLEVCTGWIFEMSGSSKLVVLGSSITTLFCDSEERAINFIENLQAEVEVEMKNFFAKFASDVVALCAYGAKIDSLVEPENDFFSMGVKLSRISAIKLLVNDVFGSELYTKRAASFFRNLIVDNLKRRKEDIMQPDFIQLLETEDLQEDEIVDQILYFTFTTFDTISTASTFLAYELSINPEIQKKLQREVDQTKGKTTYEALVSMKFLDQVVSESLRLWPPVFQDGRACAKNYQISDEGNQFLVEKGVELVIPIIALHRDSRYFPEPDRFHPERFNGKKMVLGTYLPFGTGNRNCIGSKFVILEIKLLFFYLLSKFDIVPVAKTEIPIKIAKKQFSMTPENGLWLVLKPRQ